MNRLISQWFENQILCMQKSRAMCNFSCLNFSSWILPGKVLMINLIPSNLVNFMEDSSYVMTRKRSLVAYKAN